MPGRPAQRAAHLRARPASGPTRPADRAARATSRASCRTPASRPSSSAAPCATCCSASTPKDFDIATDATPEQVKPLFRRAFIIGRRFRLVHVHAGARDGRGLDVPRRADRRRRHRRARPAHFRQRLRLAGRGRARRDFTINALYFDPANEEVWDYVGGVTDIRARRLKLIGPPVTRYREDPVRMLRAVRLAAKLGLAIDPKTAEPIREARAADRERAAGAAVRRDAEAAAVGHAVADAEEPARARPAPRPAAAARRHPRAAARAAVHRRGARQHRRARARGQGRVAGVPVRDAAVARGAGALERGEGHAARSRCPRCSMRWTACSSAQAKRIAIPRRFEATIKEIWSLQPRFEQRAGIGRSALLGASALSRRLRFPRAPRRKRRGAGGAGRLVDALPGRRRRRARRRC